MHRSIFFLTIFLTSFCLLVPLWADSPTIYIDPQDATVIRRTEIPFLSQVLLSISDLPVDSPQHEKVHFGQQKFSHISLSPDGSQIAFSVDGAVHDWAGVYDLNNKTIKEITLCFEGEVRAPFWSDAGNFIVIEENVPPHRRYLQVFDVENSKLCRLDGRRAKNKYLNFSEPWWNSAGDRIYFKVDYNNAYRKSLGLKAKKVSRQIGEAGPDCKKLNFYSVSEFMKKFPAQAQDYGLAIRNKTP